MAGERANRVGIGCLALFALPFAAVGLYSGWLVLRHVDAWAEARSWVSVPATIEWVELDADYPREPSGAGITSQDSPVRVRYFYEFAGRSYKGDRVWLGTTRDTIGSFHRDIYHELEDHRRAGRSTRCFVDPQKPQRAVLNRQMHWRRVLFLAVFAVVFGGVGLGLLAALPIVRRRLDEDREFESLHPHEPWLWQRQWRSGRIRASSKEGLVFPLVFAAFWNLLSWLIVVVAADQVFDESNRLALLALLFPAVGVGLAVWVVREIVRWRKFGESELELATFPVLLGGRLAGRVTTRWRFAPEVSPVVRLFCAEPSSNSDDQSLKVLWQRQIEVPAEQVRHDGLQSSIPFAIVLPSQARATDDRSAVWKLEVEAAVAGVDYRAKFEIPVFGSVDAGTPAASALPTDAEMEPSASELLAASGITVEARAAGGHRYLFAQARHKGAATFLTTFFLVWSGFVYLLWRIDAPVFAALFALLDVLLLLGALDLWLTRRAVEVDPTGLAFRSGFLALGRRRQVPADEVSDLRIDRGMQMGNKLYYRILLAGEKRDLTLADQLDSLALAERLVAWWWRDLAISPAQGRLGDR